MKDSELKKDKVYWAQVIDEESPHFNKQLRLKFMCIRFRDIDDKHNCFYLSQIKIFREIDYKELPDEY